MEFTDAEVLRFIQQYLIPFVRIGAMFMVMPVIGSRLVPARVRVVLAFLVSILVVPMLPELPQFEEISFSLLLWLAKEIVIGIAFGFVMQLAFQVFVLGGQLMAMKMGLGFASMNDPTNGVQTTALSQFFLLLVTLIFVSTNGHLMLITLLIESFKLLPPGSEFLSDEFFFHVVSLGSWLFASALVLALPVITSLLVVNISFGIMSRAAPQLNIFAVGFPFTLISGLALVYLGLTNFISGFERIMLESFQFIHELLQG